MGVVDFDIKRVKRVNIEDVIPNTWNPKEANTKEYKKVLDSVFKKGLRGVIVVRNHPTQEGKYEIIDGQQRYTAAKELGYEQVFIQNEGDVDDKEAKELTIWYQQQVPFERITEAYLVNGMVEAYGVDAVELPYSDKEIAEFESLAKFDFDQYKNEEPQDKLDGDIKTFKVVVGNDAYEIIMKAINKIKVDNDCGEGRALELMSADYLAGVTEDSGDEQ